MTKFVKPIPAVLVHSHMNEEYRIHGKIVAMNEATETVSMKINGRKGVEHNIPMKNIYLTEGIIDSLKNAGRSIINAAKVLIRKIKGFLIPIFNGEPDLTYINSPMNVAIMADRGDLPDAVKVIPSNGMMSAASEQNVSISGSVDDINDDINEEDCAAIERYWDNVMKEYVTNESYTVRDAVRAVNESYKRRYMRRNHINEAIHSLKTTNLSPGRYGLEVKASELIGEVMKNIMAQQERGIGQAATVSPIVIWGAPGIGKTTIVKQVCHALKGETGADLMFTYVLCSSLSGEDWGLPGLTIDKIDGVKNVQRARTIPKSWLPVYPESPIHRHNEIKDQYYNSGKFVLDYDDEVDISKIKIDERVDGEKIFDGGVIFFDELSRLPANSKHIMMGLVDQYKFDGMPLASKWTMIFASNRYEDVREGDINDYVWEDAQNSRFIHLTYVPEFDEWLEWARSINSKTGRQNIDEKYCAFIEQAPRGVWYDALDLNSRNLSEDDIKTVMNPIDSEDIQDILNREEIKGNGSWNMRTWERLNNDEQLLLKHIFRAHPELLKSLIIDGNISSSELSNAFEMLSPREWGWWADNYKSTIDPKNKMSRIAFYNAYIEKILMPQYLGVETLPTTEWKSYTEYKQIFTPDVIETIWQTGKMPKKMQDDDNIFFAQAGNYSSTNYSKWKSSTMIINQVMSMVIDGIPGGVNGFTKTLISEDQFDANGGASMTPAEANKLMTKYDKMFTVQVGKDSIPVLFNSPELKDTNNIVTKNVLYTLEHSPAARMLANVAAFFAKVAIQVNNNVIVELNKYMSMQGSLYNKMATSNKNFTNVVMRYKEQSNAHAQGGNALNEVISRCLICPAVLILMNASNRDRQYAATGKR